MICRYKRLPWGLLAVCLLLALSGCAVLSGPVYPAATDAFFVNDYADVMTPEDETAIYQAGAALQQATNAQVVLVTVDSLDGSDLESYSLGLAREWGIGDGEGDTGVLLLFTTDGPHSRIEVGYGLEGALPDSKAGRILDTYLVPWYGDSTAWSTHLTDTYTALVNEVYGEFGLTESQIPLDVPLEQPVDEGGFIEFLFSTLPFVILLVVLLSRGGLRHAVFFFPGFYGGGRGGGGFHGGGFGGGGFRGGGGGFGGGGASR